MASASWLRLFLGGWILHFLSSSLERFPVHLSTTCLQSDSGLFWRDVSLRLSHHFVADQEFADGCTTQQWWIEVEVQTGTFEFLLTAVKRSLVNAHAVRKARLKQIIISTRCLGDCFRKIHLFLVTQVDQRAYVLNGKDHGLEGPSCPPGADNQECLVLENHSLTLLSFQPSVVDQQV